jgi:hypothetical protein
MISNSEIFQRVKRDGVELTQRSLDSLDMHRILMCELVEVSCVVNVMYLRSLLSRKTRRRITQFRDAPSRYYFLCISQAHPNSATEENSGVADEL